ncbi:MAG: sorbosone dehydrogenase family protein [Lysobacter sp.]
MRTHAGVPLPPAARLRPRSMLLVALALCLSACETAKLPFDAAVGPAPPQLPAPDKGLLPTVNIAPAIGWADGAIPTAAPGLQVRAFATGLDHPRWLLVLPNGDVLVAQSNAPSGPDTGGGIKAWVMGKVMKRAGAGVPSADRITLLRDVDGDGIADQRSVLLDGLRSPFGMALVGGTLYIANADAVVAVPYRSGQTRIDERPTTVAALPGGPINHHWTKSLIASRDGRRLYAGIGSNSNVGENGMSAETNRATVMEIDPATGSTQVYASGLRNPVGLAWQPGTDTLWAVVNERDEIGSDLVPDYLTSVQRGAFYGWPYSYWGQHVDKRIQPQREDLVARAVVPDYALGNHVAPLGLAFYEGALMPQFRGGAFIGEHGSWNRRPKSGYKVVFVPFIDGRPGAPPRDVLTGFLDANERARGRPVGVAIAADGALLVADDVGNTVWRVAPHP